MNNLKITAHLILAGLGGGLMLWLGLWLANTHGQGETSTAPRLVEERASVPQPQGFTGLLNNLAGDWLKLEPWTGRSINFHSGNQSTKELLSPVLLIAVWVGLSSLIFVLSRRQHSHRRFMAGLAILFLAGWLALDIRWQRQLTSRLVDTYERYGHLALGEREKAGPDARIASAVDRIRPALTEQPTRLFILTSDTNSYMVNRLRYRLLPVRIFATARLPSRGRVHEGDHIFVMFQSDMPRYDQKQGLLINNRVSLAVDLLGTFPGIGILYRVTGEG